jgi:hypothetical protein
MLTREITDATDGPGNQGDFAGGVALIVAALCFFSYAGMVAGLPNAQEALRNGLAPQNPSNSVATLASEEHQDAVILNSDTVSRFLADFSLSEGVKRAIDGAGTALFDTANEFVSDQIKRLQDKLVSLLVSIGNEVVASEQRTTKENNQFVEYVLLGLGALAFLFSAACVSAVSIAVLLLTCTLVAVFLMPFASYLVQKKYLGANEAKMTVRFLF